MTLFSSRGTYGLLAMYELSKEYQLDKPVKIQDIAERAGIPHNYLEQLLNTLKKDGFVKSIRGAYGGYMLAENPSKIQLSALLRSLEGEMKITETSTQNGVLELLFKDAEEKLEEIFDISLKDLGLYEQKLLQQICYAI